MDLKDWILLAASVVISLLILEFESWAPKVAERLRRRAIALLPMRHRERADEEWQLVLQETPGPVSKVLVAATWFVKAGCAPASTLQDAAIRAADVAFALLLLFFLAPLLFGVSLAIYCSSPGPILYTHRRIGKDGRAFPCLRFRTMLLDRHQQAQAMLPPDDISDEGWQEPRRLSADPRISMIGRFLRRRALHTLPELVNVLRGEMSLIGPRAIREDDAESLGRNLDQLRSVRPGMLPPSFTAELEGFGDRIEVDAEYAQSRSLGKYLITLFKAVMAPILMLKWWIRGR